MAVFENVITYSNEQTWAVTIIQQVGKKKELAFISKQKYKLRKLVFST